MIKRAALLIALMVADTATTIYGIERYGMVEVNPLVGPLLALGGYGVLVLVKMVAFGLTIWAIATLRPSPAWFNLIWAVVLAVAALPVIANPLFILSA